MLFQISTLCYASCLLIHFKVDIFLPNDELAGLSSSGYRSIGRLKIESILSFKSQFYDPNSKEPLTPISSEGFLESVKARAVALGRYINVDYAEGFTVERFIGVHDITELL